MFLRCISIRKKKEIKMNRKVNLKIFVANSNEEFILKKKSKISMETVNCSFLALNLDMYPLQNC
ncbi:hypothetical protein BpHYR1_018900 [Brachionus plicatilis]|uniref:Uncharacterized protein n=1 Tax=Brachionus plicatilis TaxID=10195 RepID=A0A3M7SN38_BRAPC|nr:hypothetical protein BpHYR1_018900 [Brachionus plicatilis]